MAKGSTSKNRRSTCHLEGERCVLTHNNPEFPDLLKEIQNPPKKLYVLGNPKALVGGLAIVGARRATPYGKGCAKRFASRAAQRGICIISGGARGCDVEAHKAALEAGGQTVVFLGGGCDVPYPSQHAGLFERIAKAGGAVVSEHAWDAPPLPQQFRSRNRLIAGLARATLIVEAGLPSGTFSTADEALAAGREVLVVPGAITSANSKGANRLLYQGATPVVDDESFDDVLFSIYGTLKQKSYVQKKAVSVVADSKNPLAAILQAEPLGMEQLYSIATELCKGAGNARNWLMENLVQGEKDGLFSRYPDGRWGPHVQ